MDLQTSYLLRLASGIEELRNESVFTDVVIECGPVQFHCHRVILGATSRYFRAMFTSGMRETFSDRVCLLEVDDEALGVALRFMYTGCLSEMKEELLELVLATSHLLQIDQLHEQCWVAMSKLLSVSHFASLLHAAELYNNDKLTSQVLDFLASNWNDIVRSEDFLQLSSSQLQGLLRIISSLDSDDVFHAVYMWTKHSPDTRSLLPMIPLINMSSVSDSYLQGLLTATDDESTRQEILVSATRHRLHLVSLNASVLRFTNFHEQCFHQSKPVDLEDDVKQLVVGSSCIFMVGTGNVWRYDLEMSTVLPLPRPVRQRRHPGVAVLGSALYLLGGQDPVTSKSMCSVEVFADEEWQLVAPMRSDRFKSDAVVIGNKIYVVGGNTVSENVMKVKRCEVVEMYDSACNDWTTVTHLPFSANKLRTGELHAAPLNGNLWIMRDDSIWVYSPAEDEWESKTLTSAKSPDLKHVWGASCGHSELGWIVGLDQHGVAHRIDGTSLKWERVQCSTRASGGAATFGVFAQPTTSFLKQKLKLITFGEAAWKGVSLSQTFDHEKLEWSKVYRHSLPLNWDMAVARIGQDVYFAGGTDDAKRPTADVHRFNIATGRVFCWTTKMLHARTKASAAAINGCMYIVGGEDGTGQATTTFQKYDPVSGTCTLMPSMFQPRADAAVATHSNCLYVFGGTTFPRNQTALLRTARFDVVSNQWSMLAPPPCVLHKVRHHVAESGDKIFLVRHSSPAAFLIYDPASDQWEEREIVGGKQNTWLWSLCSSHRRLPLIYIRDGEEFFSYDVMNNQWMLLPDAAVRTVYYCVTVA